MEITKRLHINEEGKIIEIDTIINFGSFAILSVRKCNRTSKLVIVDFNKN